MIVLDSCMFQIFKHDIVLIKYLFDTVLLIFILKAEDGKDCVGKLKLR